MMRPAEEWTVRLDDSDTRFPPLALRAMLARPLLVLGAGAHRRDTRAPGVLRAEIAPRVSRDRSRIVGSADIRNLGDTTWLADSVDGTGVVWLGVQRLDADGRMVDRECWRTRLKSPVPPGASGRVDVDLRLPADVGPCRLKFDLVAERLCWFEDRGSRPAHVDV
jgi:hypothetical protein